MKKILKKQNKSRKLILQGMYSWEFTKNNTEEIENQIIKNQNKNKIDLIYIKKLLNHIPKKSKILNYILKYNIEKNTTINIIEIIIIKIALFEIFFLQTMTPKITINESLELSKKFCSKNSHMLINKILNNIIKGYIYNNNLLN